MKALRRIAIVITLFLVNALHANTDGLSPDFVETLIAPYISVESALARDELPAAQTGAKSFVDAISKAPDTDSTEATGLIKSAQAIAEAADIKTARAEFLQLSNQMVTLVKYTGTGGSTPLYVTFCPMANGGKGAAWIQADKDIANPYMGKMMYACGYVKEEIGDSKSNGSKADHAN